MLLVFILFPNQQQCEKGLFPNAKAVLIKTMPLFSNKGRIVPQNSSLIKFLRYSQKTKYVKKNFF